MDENKISVAREKVLELRLHDETVGRLKAQHTLVGVLLEQATNTSKAFSDALAAELSENGRFVLGNIDSSSCTV